MPKKEHPPAPRPAPDPRKRDQETAEQPRTSISGLVVAINGALNQTSAILQRHMDEGFSRLEELIREMRP